MGQTLSNTQVRQTNPAPAGSDPVARRLVNDRDTARQWEPESVDSEINTRALQTKIVRQLRLTETQIQFDPDAYPASAGSPGTAEVVVKVTDDVANISLLAGVDLPGLPAIRRVQVDITGGTATGKRLRKGEDVSPVDGSLVVDLVDGEAKVQVEGTGAGTVTLGLTDVDSTGLDVSDTATVTFS